MKQTTLVSLHVPKWVGPEHLKKGTRLLAEVLGMMRGNETAMRAYLECARRDGFPIRAVFTPKEELEPLCIRAFWWAFERIAKGERLPSEAK